MIRQSLAITLMNLQTIPQRLGTSLIVVVGIAGVVAVLVGLLSMATGFNAALTTSAAPDRAIILGHGSRNEMTSWLTIEEQNVISHLQGVAASSSELYTIVDLKRRDTGEQAYVVGRGVTAHAFAVRPELVVTQGRKPDAGRNELLVGRAAAREYQGLAIGDDVKLRDSAWTVVGHFESGGTANETEVWMDLSLAKSVFRRDNVSTMRVRLAAAHSAADVQSQIEGDPRLNVSMVMETEFYSAQAEVRTLLIETFTYFIASIMAAGAIVAALNSMYVAVSSRKVEIATLRAFGFGRTAIVASVMVEALALSLLGGTIGAILVYLAVDGYTTSMLNNASNAQAVFSFMVTPKLLATGLGCALALGLVGGFLPALRAARAPITTALLGR